MGLRRLPWLLPTGPIRKKSDYHMVIQDLTGKFFINYSQTSYDTSLINEDNPWLTKSKELQEVEYFSETVKELTENNHKLKKVMSYARVKTGNTGERKGVAPRKGVWKLRVRTNTGNFAWKDVAQKEGETKTKSKNKKTYHRCWKHKQCTLHKTYGCRLNKSPEAN